jgi:FKBP-type peptidyl-prolyl cis-trans isomerase 2
MPALEMQVIGMALGEEKNFVIEPNSTVNGSSHPIPTRDEDMVFEISLEQLPEDGRVLGKTLLVPTSQGQKPALVTSLEGGMATLDMNDPLAAQVLAYACCIYSLCMLHI